MTVRSLAFVLSVTAIATVGSERIFWFWSPGLTEHAIVVAYYAIAVFLTLWAVDRYRLNSWRALALALPLFAYLTEGVLTPVMYSGGPFVPVFPAWFTAWHGLLSLGVLVFGLRWLMLEGRTLLAAAVSAALGLFWGIWSVTLRLPENVEDEELIADQGGPLQVLDPSEFTQYALTFTAMIILGHWLLGHLWPHRFEPSRVTLGASWGVVGLVLVVYSIATPWALPMFVAYAGLQFWAMRRRPVSGDGESIVSQLHGRVPAGRLLPLAIIGPVAAATYALAWEVESLTAIRTIMWGTIAVQTVIGAVATVWALLGIRRSATADQPMAAVGN